MELFQGGAFLAVTWQLYRFPCDSLPTSIQHTFEKHYQRALWETCDQGWAGRGEDENPRGGAGRGGAKKRVNQMIRKFDKSA